MDPATILALIADLYAQLRAQGQTIDKLRAQLEAKES